MCKTKIIPEFNLYFCPNLFFMLIANPIYDAVFKYLLEDTEIARRLLSALIGEDIVALEIKPQEQMVYSDFFLIRVLRLDFKAIIRTEDNTFKTILIELQKGKELIDIMRFRRYLGENYKSKETILSQKGDKISVPLPLICIYFLGFRLNQVESAILKVNRVYTDVPTNEPLQVSDDFIEKLTHDCFVIQIPRLTTRYQTRIEKLLSVFNQKFILRGSSRYLDFPTETEDELLEEMLNRLNKATGNDELIRQIDAEEDLESVIEEKLRENTYLLEERDKLIQEKEKKIIEKEKAIGEKDKAIGEKEKSILEKEKVIEEKDKAIEALLREIDKLKKT